MKLKKLSVCTILQDEEEVLPYFLTFIEKSIGFDILAEIVFVDGGSTDKSLDIIRNWNNGCEVKIIHNKFKSFGKQKNIGLENCTGEWILSLDVDMTCTTNFRKELLAGAFNGCVLWDFKLFFTMLDKFHHSPVAGATTRLFRNYLGIKYIWDIHEHPVLLFKEIGLDYSKEADRKKAFDLMHSDGRLGFSAEVTFFEHSLRISDEGLLKRGKRTYNMREASAKRGIKINRKNRYLTRRDGTINNKRVTIFPEKIRKIIP